MQGAYEGTPPHMASTNEPLPNTPWLSFHSRKVPQSQDPQRIDPVVVEFDTERDNASAFPQAVRPKQTYGQASNFADPHNHSSPGVMPSQYVAVPMSSHPVPPDNHSDVNHFHTHPSPYRPAQPCPVPPPGLVSMPVATQYAPQYGFTQTHQVKGVQVFSGHVDSRVLIDDWIRDMQYLLDAGGLPPHFAFATVVRHLSGEARKLVLNLPAHEQTPTRAFEELRHEYSDTQTSVDSLADFYERSQKYGESPCSYAIVLEATLRAAEDLQNRGLPFPDRDVKLIRQFFRGLSDEEVYLRLAPVKSKLSSFRELQAELRSLAREGRRFQTSTKSKKTVSQVHVQRTEPSQKPKPEIANKQKSDLSELTELVKKLALSQEAQLQRLSDLEAKLAKPSTSLVGHLHPQASTKNKPDFICHRCGKPGHVARYCRAILPAQEQGQAVNGAEANQPLNA